MAHSYILEREQRFLRPRAELFAFFEDARNLGTITPPFLDFRILTAMPIEMKAGAELTYRIKLHGIPVRWHTLIESYDQPHAFVDRQLQGPYRLWHHTHTFEEVPGGTLMRDVVRYALPFGPLGRIVHALMIKKTLAKIFDYRAAVLRDRFGALEA